MGFVWASGKYQVDSHSSSVSHTRANSVVYPAVGSKERNTPEGRCSTPPGRGGEGGTGGGKGYLVSSPLINAGAAEAKAVGSCCSAGGEGLCARAGVQIVVRPRNATTTRYIPG